MDGVIIFFRFNMDGVIYDYNEGYKALLMGGEYVIIGMITRLQ